MDLIEVLTVDGYTLYFVGGVWVDNLDAANVDLTFDDDNGWPMTDGERLQGRIKENTND